MKIINICVSSCKHEPYCSNAKYMVESYNRIARYLNLPIHAFYFFGNETDMNYLNDDNISLAFSDSDIAVKQYMLLQCIVEHHLIYCDIHIQTNSSTVLNIVKLYEYICKNYDDKCVYCNYINYLSNDRSFPSGYFWMTSKDILQVLYKDWLSSKEALKSFSREKANEFMWEGIGEDFIIGDILKINNIPLKRIENFVCFPKTTSENLNYMTPNIYDYIGIYAKTHEENIKARSVTEPDFIEFLTLLFEKHVCIPENNAI